MIGPVNLDLLCLGILVLAAVVGAFAGALSQLAHAAAVAAGWVGARALGPRLALLLQGKVPAFAAHPLGALAAFVGCTAVAALAARLLIALTPLRRAPGSGPDRALGALMGGLQAAVVLWIALSALAVWNRPVQLGGLRVDPERSELVGAARQWSALGTAARR